MIERGKISPLLQVRELLNIYQREEVVMIDASNGKDAKTNFDKKHLDRALFVDLNTQLADIKKDVSQGGRHPLPSIEHFSETLATLGISQRSHVIIYDDQYGANAAARFWWMLKAIGHEKVQVLDGGFQAAEKAGFPINSSIKIPYKSGTYKIEKWQLPLATIFEIEQASLDESYRIIDVRDSERFNGEKEPIDLIAGHIPNAMNIPFMTNLDNQGFYLSPEELKNKYLAVFRNIKSENRIVHCGSGVTACYTLLAIAYAGLEIPKLYVGSWSEWSRSNKKMITKPSEK